MTPTAAPCSACRQPPGSSLACLACGALLDEDIGASHFERLGAERSPHQDAAALESTYLRLSRLLHPDFHGRAGDDERAASNRASALLNEAWRVLTDETARAEYLLGLHDPDALDRHKTLPPDFLMDAMERSEAIEEAAGDPTALAALSASVRTEIEARRQAVADESLWQGPDIERLAVLLHELRVFRRILRDAEAGA